MPKCDFNKVAVLKIYSKFTGEHPSRSVILIRLLCNIIEITLRHECSRVNLLHIFRTPFPKNTSGGLLLFIYSTHSILFKSRSVHNTLFVSKKSASVPLLNINPIHNFIGIDDYTKIPFCFDKVGYKNENITRLSSNNCCQLVLVLFGYL